MLLILFCIKFNGLVQSIFYNKYYQVSYPSIVNSSNNIPYTLSDEFIHDLPTDSTTIKMKKLKIFGNLSEHALEIYNQNTISHDKIMNLQVCETNELKYFFVGNTIFPLHHQWFETNKFVMSIYNPLKIEIETLNTSIGIPTTDKVSWPFYLMNIFSLIFSLDEDFLKQYPIVFGSYFDNFEEIIDLAGLSDMDIKFPNITKIDGHAIFSSNSYFLKVPDSYEVSHYSIEKMVKFIKPKIEKVESTKVPIIISTDGDKRLIGKKKMYEDLNTSFSDKIEEIDLAENISVTEILSKFVNAKVAIGFSSQAMSLVPFMDKNGTYIEIQKPDTVSRNVLLARSFGLKVYVFTVADYNITDDIIEGVKKIISKVL